MLETIREFAADRLDQRPEFASRARRAHATYFAEMARRLRRELTGDQRETALAAMAADVGNLRIAWGHWVASGDLEQLDKLADSLLILNDARGWYLDTVGLTTDMLAVLGANSPRRTGSARRSPCGRASPGPSWLPGHSRRKSRTRSPGRWRSLNAAPTCGNSSRSFEASPASTSSARSSIRRRPGPVRRPGCGPPA